LRKLVRSRVDDLCISAQKNFFSPEGGKKGEGEWQ
jgi:hypothetical protein